MGTARLGLPTLNRLAVPGWQPQAPASIPPPSRQPQHSRATVGQYSYSNSRAGAIWGEKPSLSRPVALNGDGED